MNGADSDPPVLVGEEVEDIVAALIAGGDKITATYDDGGDGLSIDTSALDTEEVEDTVAALIGSSANVSIAYDDTADTLTISLSGPIEGIQLGTDATRSDVFGDLIDANTVEAGGSVTANGTEYAGTFATESDLPDPSNYPVGAEATVESDPNGQTSVYKLVDE